MLAIPEQEIDQKDDKLGGMGWWYCKTRNLSSEYLILKLKFIYL